MGGRSTAIDHAQALEEVMCGKASKETERLRSLMIDSITHELRTPLTAVKAAATTLLLHGEIGAREQREMLTVIDEESDRLNRLVSQAMEMAQLDTQEVHMSFAPVRPRVMVEHAIETCSSSCRTTRSRSVCLNCRR